MRMEEMAPPDLWVQTSIAEFVRRVTGCLFMRLPHGPRPWRVRKNRWRNEGHYYRQIGLALRFRVHLTLSRESEKSTVRAARTFAELPFLPPLASQLRIYGASFTARSCLDAHRGLPACVSPLRVRSSSFLCCSGVSSL